MASSVVRVARMVGKGSKDGGGGGRVIVAVGISVGDSVGISVSVGASVGEDFLVLVGAGVGVEKRSITALQASAVNSVVTLIAINITLSLYLLINSYVFAISFTVN